MNDITQTMLVLAAALAQQNGIKLRIDPNATTFATDGSTLVMPPLAKLQADMPVAAELEKYLLGAIVHESGHIRFTDLEIRHQFRVAYEGHERQTTANQCGQILEDIVVERGQCNALLGARRMLTQCWEMLLSRRKPDPQDMTEDELLMRYVFSRARHSVLKTEATLEFAQQRQLQCQSLIEPALLANIEGEFAVFDLISCSSDAAQSASRLLATMGIQPNQSVQAPQSTTQPQQSPQGQQGQASNDPQAQPPEGSAGEPDDQAPPTQGQGQGEGDESAHEPQAQPTTGGAGDPDDQASPTQGQTQAEEPTDGAQPAIDPQAQPAQGGAGETDDQPYEILDLVTEAINEIDEALPDDQEYVTVIGQAPGTGFKTEHTAVHHVGMQLRSRLLMHTMMARARLETLLKAETQGQSRYARKGRIVPSRLWKLQSGNMNVFRQTVEGQELDTAILVLLDDSGSMSGAIGTAIEAACFVPLALDDVPGVHTSIHVFPGYAKASQRLKGFGDRLTPCLDALASVEAHGGTPLSRALMEVGTELMGFEAHRRLLIVVTDGQPDSSTEAKAELRRLEQADVEIIGIGIGCSLRHLIRDFTNINAAGELTQSLYELLQRKLLKLPAAA